VFNALTRADLRRIVDLQVTHLRAMLADRRIELELTDEARDALAEEGWDPHFGARPLKRTLQRRVQNPLAMKLLEGAFQTGDTVRVGWEDGTFSFRSFRPGEVPA
jgi:ATP-dependent Clp protease ATP-binding subunit ClpB